MSAYRCSQMAASRPCPVRAAVRGCERDCGVSYTMKGRMNYSDFLLDEWGADKQPPRFKACIRRVLGELSPGAHLLLLHAPSLQVTIRPEADFSVWAYFPVHKNRRIVRQLSDDGISLRPSARVLLVISEKLCEGDADNMRDHLGHILLYLQHPRAKNDCEAALREWSRNLL